LTADIIPHNIWLLLKEFVDAKATGTIVLHVKSGVILSGRIEQEIRAN
jgi:hypothetical protein